MNLLVWSVHVRVSVNRHTVWRGFHHSRLCAYVIVLVVVSACACVNVLVV